MVKSEYFVAQIENDEDVAQNGKVKGEKTLNGMEYWMGYTMLHSIMGFPIKSLQ